MMGMRICVSKKCGMHQEGGGSSGRNETYLDTQWYVQKNNLVVI